MKPLKFFLKHLDGELNKTFGFNAPKTADDWKEESLVHNEELTRTADGDIVDNRPEQMMSWIALAGQLKNISVTTMDGKPIAPDMLAANALMFLARVVKDPARQKLLTKEYINNYKIKGQAFNETKFEAPTGDMSGKKFQELLLRNEKILMAGAAPGPEAEKANIIPTGGIGLSGAKPVTTPTGVKKYL